jgi:membrane associated rhomboid family serine protease
MGLSDRDYIRRPETSGLAGGLGALRGVSVTTALIVLCVAVFVIDQFMPVVDVPTGDDPPHVQWVVPDAAKLDRSQVVFGQGYLQHPQTGMRWKSLHERSSGQLVGWAEIMPMHWLTAKLHFSTRLGGLEFWRFLGFQFLHASIAHLVFNMIGLFFFGPIVEDALGRKRFLAFYLLCGCCGALMYLILNGIGYFVFLKFGNVAIPGLLFSDPSTPLVGASASIFGVIMAGAYLAPNATAVYLIFPMRLQTLAYFLVGLALFTVVTAGRNAGGEASHLGGAIAGAYFIRHAHHLHNFFDILGRVDPTSHHYQQGAVRRNAPPQRWRNRVADPAEIDRILEKISRDGLHSLSDDEKRILAQASER